MEEVKFSFIRSIETAIVKELKLFFGHQPAVKGFESIEKYRWLGDHTSGEAGEETKLNIFANFPTDERLFPCIIVLVSPTGTTELGFEQYAGDADNLESIGGILKLSVGFVVESISGLDIEEISDLLVIGLVSNWHIRGRLGQAGINVIAPNRNVVSFNGTSTRDLTGGTKVKRVSWKYNDIMVQWSWDINVTDSYVTEIAITDSKI